MGLQKKIKADLTVAIKARDDDRKNAIRIIMGEFSRCQEKTLPDDDVIKIIKKLIKSEQETLLQQKKEEDSPFIAILESYLPQMASEGDVEAWINANIDFQAFNNKMQAMRPIMAHFGSTVDGNTVKKILQRL